MNVQFEGSAQQRRILKLREVEEALDRIQTVTTLLSRCAHEDDMDSVALILADAETALDRLGEVER